MENSRRACGHENGQKGKEGCKDCHAIQIRARSLLGMVCDCGRIDSEGYHAQTYLILMCVCVCVTFLRHFVAV